MQDQNHSHFWSIPSQELLELLHSSINGLTSQDAQSILRNQGISKKTLNPFTRDLLLFLSQFKSPLMLLLIGAVVISALLGDTSDVFIILFILLSTGVLSFVKERNASKVVQKLQSMISIKSTVLRDGKEIELETDKIVPGDILILNAGDMLPADCLLLEANALHANESSLTGESFPVQKDVTTLQVETSLTDRFNCLWEGTNIVSGNGKAVVVLTGNNTLFSGIVSSASKVVETNFEKGLKEFGYFLMRITLILAAFILAINLLNGKGIVESALFALALAVGMSPELLPAISTIAMSAGAKRLLDKQVVVKKLNSVQNLGEVDLLCTDKTGTITEGNIVVSSVLDISGLDSPFAQKLACWNAALETGYSNAIDASLKLLILPESHLPVKLGEVPYDFIRKRLSIAIRDEEVNLLISKGAVMSILEICDTVRFPDGSKQSMGIHHETLLEQFHELSKKGLRIIGVCYKEIVAQTISKEDEVGMIFAGFVVFEDPIKPEIQQVLTTLSELHVGVKIITGDHEDVARNIAGQIGIQNPIVLTGKQLAGLSPEALTRKATDTHIFAEIEPQQKEQIILALRKSYTVAYLGDGINDVAAINAADVGISVNNAVDVAREAADFVLLEKSLSVLADGIREGRKTFANTLKYLYINTGSTFGNMFSVAAASLILPFLPMLPKQILLTNFLTDFPFLTISSDNVDEEQVERPGRWNLKQIRNYMIVFGIHSSIFDLITFMTLFKLLAVKESAFQTGWFIESVLTELFILFIIRTHKNFFQSKPAKYMIILSALALILTVALPYLPIANSIGLTPLPWPILGAMLTIVTAYILTADLLKVWFFRHFNQIENSKTRVSGT